MTFTLFSVNVLLIFAIALFTEVRKGAKKGFVRTLISLGNIILSAIVASAFSPLVVSVLCNMFSIRLINLNTSYGNISTSANFTAEMFIFMAAAPFVAVLTFFLARGIIALIVAMIRKNKFNNFSSSGKYGSDERSYVRRNDKKLGIATGIICAFIVTAIVTAPLMGTVNILDRVLKMVESVDKKTAQNIYKNWESKASDLYSAIYETLVD